MSFNTNILYVSCLCSKKIEQQILDTNPKGIGLQAQKYHRLLAKGLCNNNSSVNVLCYQKGIKDLGVKNRDTEEEKDIKYVYLTNSRLGYVGLLFNSFTYSYDFFKRNKEAVMICDVLNLTVSLGALLAAKLLKRRTVGIITDYPDHLFGEKSSQSRLIWFLIKLCDGYVVLTEQMKEKLNPKKAMIVLEGHVDSEMIHSENKIQDKYTKKVCIYAGMLHRKYGIEKLVKAFIKADVLDAELHIYGDGDYVEELKELGKNSIRYFGIVENQKVVEEELKSTLLINPRPSDEEFTKYSFPSKNLEYMVSGTPLLTTNLPGMPKEYRNYVFLFEKETIDGMANTLKSVLGESKTFLHDKGMRGKQYVLENKTEAAQALKLLQMIDRMS